MPRKKKRIPLSREEALRTEDEFMLNYGHLSLWYDGWYNSRGKAIIDAREKTLSGRRNFQLFALRRRKSPQRCRPTRKRRPLVEISPRARAASKPSASSVLRPCGNV